MRISTPASFSDVVDPDERGSVRRAEVALLRPSLVVVASVLWGQGEDHEPGVNPLTCDFLVTYFTLVTDDDRVFKALADPTRRFLLDLLFARDGQTLTELESAVEMTRYGVMKHLRVLEEADLVVSRKSGREKLHFLNPAPIRLIHDRRIDKYTEREVAALADLKHELEEQS